MVYPNEKNLFVTSGKMIGQEKTVPKRMVQDSSRYVLRPT